MVIKTSQAGIDLIKQFEGCKLDAYQCPAGIWTIGYGTTRLPDGKAVREGLMITTQRAELLLQHALIEFERQVNRLITVEITQPMFDALVCFAYNVGAGNLSASTLLEKLNDGNFAGAANEFQRWNKANGKPMHGLNVRRKAEKELFLSGVKAQ